VLRFVAANPALGVFSPCSPGLPACGMLGAIAALDRNPWDDDIAYTR